VQHLITSISVDGTGVIITLYFDGDLPPQTLTAINWVQTDVTLNSYTPATVIAPGDNTIVMDATGTGCGQTIYIFANPTAIAQVQFVDGGTWSPQFGTGVPA
jgi:hypothetical protein